VKTHANFRIYVQISGPNYNFRTFQDKFQNFRNFRTTPRPAQDLNTRHKSKSTTATPFKNQLFICIMHSIWKSSYSLERNEQTVRKLSLKLYFNTPLVAKTVTMPSCRKNEQGEAKKKNGNTYIQIDRFITTTTVIRDHSLPRFVEFWDRPQNLAIYAVFSPCVSDILCNSV